MQTRQTHRKSRRGCWQCKKAHVKCDENHPKCLRCSRKSIDCDYSPFRHLRHTNGPPDLPTKVPEMVGPMLLPVLHRGRSLSDNAGLYHAYEANAIHPRGPSSRTSKHLFELRLIKTFVSGGGPTQKSYQDGRHVQISIDEMFRLAAEPRHFYLMDIILGLTAIGLRTSNPDDQALIEASHTYALQSIQECSKQISTGINESNAEGLFVASLLIAMHAFTSQQYEDFTLNGVNESGQIPLLSWLKQFQGVKAIRNEGWAWIKNSPAVKPMLSALPAHADPDLGAKGFFNYLLEDLDENDTDAETIAAYRAPVQYIACVIHQPDRHGLLGFPMSISERFLELLEAKDPRAMTIIGSYLALMTLARRSRYLIEAAKRDFQFIMAHLPTEWTPRMRWAKDIFVLNDVQVKDVNIPGGNSGIEYLSASS